MDYMDVSMDRLVYYSPVKSEGRYVSKILYGAGAGDSAAGAAGAQPLEIVAPPLRIFGEPVFSENRCYMTLALERQHSALYNFFSDIDDANVEVSFRNCDTWFGHHIPLDMIDDCYKPFVKSTRTPTIKVRLPHVGNVLNLPDVTIEQLKQDTLVKPVLRCEGIRFNGKQFGSMWSVVSLKLVGADEYIDYEFFHDRESDMILADLGILNRNIPEPVYYSLSRTKAELAPEAKPEAKPEAEPEAEPEQVQSEVQSEVQEPKAYVEPEAQPWSEAQSEVRSGGEPEVQPSTAELTGGPTEGLTEGPTAELTEGPTEGPADAQPEPVDAVVAEYYSESDEKSDEKSASSAEEESAEDIVSTVYAPDSTLGLPDRRLEDINFDDIYKNLVGDNAMSKMLKKRRRIKVVTGNKVRKL